jgi:multidrug transporter EmrE-like cation transporter
VLLGSINIVALMIAGRVLFREKLTPLRVTGMLLVTAGVAVVGAGS